MIEIRFFWHQTTSTSRSQWSLTVKSLTLAIFQLFHSLNTHNRHSFHHHKLLDHRVNNFRPSIPTRKIIKVRFLYWNFRRIFQDLQNWVECLISSEWMAKFRLTQTFFQQVQPTFLVSFPIQQEVKAVNYLISTYNNLIDSNLCHKKRIKRIGTLSLRHSVRVQDTVSLGSHQHLLRMTPTA